MRARVKETEIVLRRWRRKVGSDPKLKEEVHGVASRLLSGVQWFVEERQRRLVEDVVMEAALVPLTTDRLTYVV